MIESNYSQTLIKVKIMTLKQNKGPKKVTKATCPICGSLVDIRRFKKVHSFPRVVILEIGGRCHLKYYPDVDNEKIEEFKELVIEKMIDFLTSQGFEVKKQNKQ